MSEKNRRGQGVSAFSVPSGRRVCQRMYAERPKNGNVPAFRGCGFLCSYCSFKKLIQLNTKCPDCMAFKPHFHLEVLERIPSKTKDGQFLTFGLSSDVSFMNDSEWLLSWAYLRKWSDRTFLVQSKDPAVFLKWQDVIPNNVIIGTTIETTFATFRNQDYDVKENPHEFTTYKECGTGRFDYISRAPLPLYRYHAMKKLTCRKAVTIEPILDFDEELFIRWIKDIKPEIIWIGYANDGHEGKKLRLPEPSWNKTQALIGELLASGIDVREKSLRNAWCE